MVKKVYKIIYKSVDIVHEIVYLIDVLKRYTNLTPRSVKEQENG